MHPVLIAVNAAMFDHLAQGRFILGVSAGALTSDAEAIGLLDEDRNKIFAEAIDVILAIWERDPPYDIDFPDNRFKVARQAHRRARSRRRLHGQALPEAAAGDRRHGGGAVLARRGADGQARLPSAVGQLPAGAASEVALGQLRQGQGGSRREGQSFRLARGAHHLRRRRRQDRAPLRLRGRQQPLPLLFRADARQDEARQPALRVQEPQGAAGRRRSRSTG